MKPTFSIFFAVASCLALPTFADTKVTERQASFGECRAYLQALAGALAGKLAKYSEETSTVLESSFESKDGTIKYTITCLANEQKMVIREEAS
ncbi:MULTISPECIES: hypothetical protein [unclassified Phaeobacter]|uniref:hypothetical protein n=1 Tax=unclassified Phaeobacter TaxID=2621772 RepID=UPI003A882EEA